MLKDSAAVNKVQLKWRAKSIHRISSFNKKVVYFSLSWKTRRSLGVSFVPQPVSLFLKALVAEDTPQIAPHLISSPSLLLSGPASSSSQWQVSSSERLCRLACTHKHGRRSLNHALTTWSFLSPPLPPAPALSISLAVAYRWGYKLIIGMSSAHSDT